MKKIMTGISLLLLIALTSITAYAAFPTFVRTEEYRSDMYAVENIASGDEGVEDTTDAGHEEIITDSLVP